MTRPAKRSGAGVASETRDGAEHLTCWPRLLLSHHFAAASTSELRAVVRALNSSSNLTSQHGQGNQAQDVR
jgi:hypothetical protein